MPGCRMPGMQGAGATPVTSGEVPGQARHSPVSGGSCPHQLDRPGRAARSSAPFLPPAGSGPLILGVDASNRIVMSWMGSTAAPVPVPGLPDVANFSWQIATNPAGGWAVTYPTAAANPDGEQPSRLATVTASGAIKPFGPAFGRNKAVLSIAVSPDGEYGHADRASHHASRAAAWLRQCHDRLLARRPADSHRLLRCFVPRQ